MSDEKTRRRARYLHLRARAYRLEVPLLADDAYASDETFPHLTDAEYERREADLVPVKAEIEALEKEMNPDERAQIESEAEKIEKQAERELLGAPILSSPGASTSARRRLY